MMQERITDFRFNFNWTTIDDHIAGNYYPVTSALSFIDEKSELKVNLAPDRAQGGSVIEKGKI